MRVRGNKGELAGEALSSHPERVRRVFVNEAPLEVETVWFHGGQVIFKFQGVDSISDAERLAGADVCIPREERLPLDAGEYYLTDLVGAEIVDPSGRALGKVTGWREYGGPMLLEALRPNGKELLIPFAKSICVSIDAEAKRIVAILPEGLEDLQ